MNYHAIGAGLLIAVFGVAVITTAKSQPTEVVREIRNALGFILMFLGLATAFLGLGHK